ncbi:MAG: M56 family metallopeptidase [Aquaticitalea sp.]
MLVYLLKFSACLAIFLVFYKLFLERENMHKIKRYYLLVTIFIALSIPLITFTSYVEPDVSEVVEFQTFQITEAEPENIAAKPNYLPIILWTIYSLGVLLFASKFILNLSKIFIKINSNPKHKSKDFTHVLLRDLVTPHTFFNFIFLNKQKFETREIPEEVFIHEEAHARQKHSIDILLIELLQIVFWFNPLIYLTKESIKMNHEFLADEAVLEQGISPSIYQQLLLTFSSNVTEPQLANAINYSSIKKRFTVMKTQTSKQKIWLRSFLLVPLVAITLYGFSATKEVIKTSEDLQVSNSDNTARSISIEILEDGIYIIDGITVTKSTLITEVNKLHQDITPDIRNNIMNIHITSSSEISNEEIWFIYNSLLDYGFYRMVAGEQEIVKGKGNTPFAIEQTQQKATAEEVAEYNKIAKHCNYQIETKSFIVKEKDVKRLEQLYAKMSIDQKNDAEPYPDFSNFPPPPPPPPPATGFVNVNGETLFVIYYSPKRYYNKKGYLVDKNGKTLNGHIQVHASDVLPGQYITKVYQNDKVVVEFKNNKPEMASKNLNIPPPPPPPPKSPLDHVIDMAKKGATFYYEGNSISSDDAIKLLKENKELNISTKEVNSKQPKVYIQKDPIHIND